MTYKSTILADSPLSLWMLDEPSGSSAADSAGANTGTYQGSPTYNQPTSAGNIPYSVSLPGAVSSYVLANSSQLIGGLTNSSVEMWLKCYPSPASTYDTSVTGTSGVARYYKLNETSGTTATDTVGGSSGTYSGAFTLNQPGPTTNGSVLINNGGMAAATIASKTNVSMECWFYASTTATGGLIMHNGVRSGSDNGYGVSLGTDASPANGKLSIIFPTIVSQDTGYVVTAGRWYHIVLVLDGSSHPTLYVNGGSVYSSGSITPSTPSGGSLLVGLPRSPSFPGYITNFAFYNAALSAGTVAAHYNAAGIDRPLYCERNTSGTDSYWFVGLRDGAQLMFAHRDNAGTAYSTFVNKNMFDQSWHHLVVTKSGTTIVIYIDGVSRSSTTMTGTDTMNTSNLDVRLGGDGNPGSTTDVFTGRLAAAAVYSAALTSTQVHNHFAAGTNLDTFTKSLVADTFNGTNGAAFNGHVTDSGNKTWTADAKFQFSSSNYASSPSCLKAVVSGSATSDYAIIDPGLSYYTYEVSIAVHTVINTVTIGRACVVFRYVDANNYWYVLATPNFGNGSIWQLYNRKNGASVLVLDLSSSFSGWGNLAYGGVRVNNNGNFFEVYTNFPGVDSGWTIRYGGADDASATATKLGVLFTETGGSVSNDQSAYYDNLSVCAAGVLFRPPGVTGLDCGGGYFANPLQ